MKTKIVFLLSVLWSVSLGAQEIALGDWLGRVADNKLVTEVLLPGSHDAGTGEGFQRPEAETYAVTQDVSLALQFESGIRAFDIRPAMCGDTLMIAHGLFVTNISFPEALAVFGRKLKEHPTEFIVMLMRNEREAQFGEGSYEEMMEHALKNAQCDIIPFRADLTVGEMRGKVLVFSRNELGGGSLCSFIPNWPDMPEYAETSIKSQGSGVKAEATLLVQDYYETVGEKQQVKNAALTNMFALAKEKRLENPATWVMNYASGYADTDATGYSYSSGYRQNAASTSASLRRFLQCGSCAEGAAGIVYLDFAGVDVSGGFFVGGLAATKAMIKANF